MTGQFRESAHDARRTLTGFQAILASTAMLSVLAAVSSGCASSRNSCCDKPVPWPEPNAHLQVDYLDQVYSRHPASETVLEQQREPTLAVAFSEPVAAETSAGMDEDIFPTRSLRLAEMLSMLRETPRMVALRTTLNVVQADRLQAELLPNPEFHYERFVTLTGDSDAANDPNQFSVSQPLLLFGQRGTAITTADLEISAAQAEVLAEYADLVFQVRHRFASLSVREQAVRVLRESLEHFDRVERLVEGRFLEGDVREYDVERIRLEVHAFRSQLAAAKAEVADISGELAVLLGTSDWSPRTVGGVKPLDVQFRYDELLDSMQRVHPRILAAQRREAAAQSNILLASQERLPVPELELGWFDAQAPVRNFAGAMYIGVSVPTPVFDRGQAAIARAQAEAAVAALQRQADTVETQADLRRALAVLQHLRSTLEIYSQQIRERLPRLQRMAEDGYEMGEIRIVELLDGINLFVEPQLQYLELLEAVMHAELEVLAAAGMIEGYIE